MVVHTIVEGDTPWGLAVFYDVTVAAIMALNPGLDPTGLQIGDIVRIPANAASTPTPTPTATPTPTPSPSPPPTPEPTPTRTEVVVHTIVEGDTPWGLAVSYDVTVAAILELNPGLDATGLQIGDIVRIPANAASTSTPTPTATPTPGSGPTLADLELPASGWGLIAWRGAETAAADAIGQTRVRAIHAWDALAQRWVSYFPELAGFGVNTLTTLVRGGVYFVYVAEPGEGAP